MVDNETRSVFSKGHRGLILEFSDYEQLDIPSFLCQDEVVSAVREIEPGSLLKMNIHPTGNDILEMKYGDTTILHFDDSVQEMSSEKCFFIFLGIFLYFIAGYAFLEIIRKNVT